MNRKKWSKEAMGMYPLSNEKLAEMECDFDNLYKIWNGLSLRDEVKPTNAHSQKMADDYQKWVEAGREC